MRQMSINFHERQLHRMYAVNVRKKIRRHIGNILSLSHICTVSFSWHSALSLIFYSLSLAPPMFRSLRQHISGSPTRIEIYFMKYSNVFAITIYLKKIILTKISHGKCENSLNFNVPTAGILLLVVLKSAELLSVGSQEWIVFLLFFLFSLFFSRNIQFRKQHIKVSVIVGRFVPAWWRRNENAHNHNHCHSGCPESQTTTGIERTNILLNPYFCVAQEREWHITLSQRDYHNFYCCKCLGRHPIYPCLNGGAMCENDEQRIPQNWTRMNFMGGESNSFFSWTPHNL